VARIIVWENSASALAAGLAAPSASGLRYLADQSVGPLPFGCCREFRKRGLQNLVGATLAAQSGWQWHDPRRLADQEGCVVAQHGKSVGGKAG
jgi:hypothetical protein